MQALQKGRELIEIIPPKNPESTNILTRLFSISAAGNRAINRVPISSEGVTQVSGCRSFERKKKDNLPNNN